MPTPVDPASPCVGICEMDAVTGWCRGCFRTLPEITAWRDLSPAAKHDVRAVLAERRTQAGSRSGPSVDRAKAWAARWSEPQ